MRAPSARSFSSSVCSSAASDCSCRGSQRDSIARTRRTVATSSAASRSCAAFSTAACRAASSAARCAEIGGRERCTTGEQRSVRRRREHDRGIGRHPHAHRGLPREGHRCGPAGVHLRKAPRALAVEYCRALEPTRSIAGDRLPTSGCRGRARGRVTLGADQDGALLFEHVARVLGRRYASGQPLTTGPTGRDSQRHRDSAPPAHLHGPC